MAEPISRVRSPPTRSASMPPNTREARLANSGMESSAAAAWGLNPRSVPCAFICTRGTDIGMQQVTMAMHNSVVATPPGIPNARPSTGPSVPPEVNAGGRRRSRKAMGTMKTKQTRP